MRMFSIVSLIFLLIMSMFIVNYRGQEDNTLETLQSNLSTVYNATEPIFEAFPYKNPYDANFTVIDFAKNTGHVIAYPIIYEFHTVIGAGTTLIWKGLTDNTIVNIVKVFFSVLFLWLLSIFIKPTGVIYVLVNEYFEKRNKQIPVWLAILISIGIMILLIALILILVGVWSVL